MSTTEGTSLGLPPGDVLALKFADSGLSVGEQRKMRVLLAIAGQAARLSTCAKLPVGAAVATPELRHISLGCNGPFAGGLCEGGEHCECFHAEDNVLQRTDPDLGGLWLAVTVTPCPTCARRIINSGSVKRVLIGSRYKERGSELLLRQNGIAVYYA